jgi:Family of unknown function (DUF6524)
MGLFLRWLGALILVAATYNPTPWNYIRWADAHFTDQMPLTLLLGLILGIGYLIYFMATVRSIGLIGIVLVAALFGLTIWVLIDWGVLSLTNADLNAWIAIFVLSAILGLGLSWSILRQRLSGQATVDEVED